MSIKKLWRLYNADESPLLRVKCGYFSTIFITDYNISFGTPSKCVPSNSNSKQNLITELRIHKLRAKLFYDILRKEKEGEFTLSFDCQKNMVFPKLPDQVAYYSRQLYMYNFTVCLVSSKTNQNIDNTFIYT